MAKIITTHPDKIIYPKNKITKGMIVEYYTNIAPQMYELTKDHILTMQRFPEGIEKEGFWHKNCPDFFPKWIKRFETKKEDGEPIAYPVISKPEIFPFVANYYSIVNHIWLSTLKKPDRPDRIVFDLDPSKKNDFAKVQEVALIVKDILDKNKIISFVMTTGSRGLHIVIPLKTIYTHDETKAYAKKVALEAIEIAGNKATLEIRKEKRDDKVFIDTLRNNYAQTAVAPYSLRAKDGAPVATPITWKEATSKKLLPTSFDIYNVLEHSKQNPWEDFYKIKNKLV